MKSLVRRFGPASWRAIEPTAPGGCGATCWRKALSCGLHRIERLMRLQALKARPRRRRLPPDLGERQAAAVAPNVLDRSFEAAAPNRKWIADFTYVWTAEGWLYVAAVIDLFSRRVVGWSMSASDDGAARHRCPGDGDLAARQARCAAASLRSRQPIHQRTVPAADGRQRRHLLDEPLGQRLGQCRDGELLLVAEDRAHRRKTYRTRTKPEPMCSTTSSASTIPNDGTRRSVI